MSSLFYEHSVCPRLKIDFGYYFPTVEWQRAFSHKPIAAHAHAHGSIPTHSLFSFSFSRKRRDRTPGWGAHLPVTPARRGPRAGPHLRVSLYNPHFASDLCRLSLSGVSVLGSALPTCSHARRSSPNSKEPPNTSRGDNANEERLQKLCKIDSDARLEEQPMVPHGRVHPAATSSSYFSGEMNQSAASSDPSSSPLYSFHFEKPVPPTAQPPPTAGTYVVQMPKDKVFRVPPPENARLFQHYTRRAKRRARCSCVRVCSWLLLALVVLTVVLAVFAAVIYLVFKPRQPDYTLQSLAVSGLGGVVGNASFPSAAPVAFSPEFDATVRANNPNSKIGVHYEGDGSHIAVSYGGVRLADGAWPAFYQGPKNVTVFVATAKGSGIRFSERLLGEIAAAGRLRSVPFDVDIKVPVRLQFGEVKTWAVPVRVRCTVAVDRLAADAKVVSKSCGVKVRFLFWKD